MVRDFNEEKRTRYFNAIKVKEKTPKFFWCKCEKCGKSFKREPIYHCSALRLSVWGCKECFSDEKDFRSYLEENHLLATEDNFDPDLMIDI